MKCSHVIRYVIVAVLAGVTGYVGVLYTGETDTLLDITEVVGAVPKLL